MFQVTMAQRISRALSELHHLLHIAPTWFYREIGPGDTVNVIGEFNDQGKCIVHRENNVVIVHPDILVSGTRESEVPTIDFGSSSVHTKVQITEVMDIEEMAWAPRYGLKGVIDASVRVKVDSNITEVNEKILPLEFKTEKATSGQSFMEHCAQVVLYTLLMSERYLKQVDSGLLYYLHTDQTQGITAQRSDLVGLIMRRNDLANYMLKASMVQQLPPMLQNPNVCRGCRHLNVCTIYHKTHGGNIDSSGLGDVYDSNVKHLTVDHCNFLQQWDRLIDLEAEQTQTAKKKLWRSQNQSQCSSTGLSSVKLDLSEDFSSNTYSNNGRYLYRFACQDLSPSNTEMHNGWAEDASPLLRNNLDCTLKCGDYVV